MTNDASFGRLLEAMWVNPAKSASKAVMYDPAHHYYLTADGNKVLSKDFEVDQPNDPTSGWELVSID